MSSSLTKRPAALPHVLVVDDEPELCELLEMRLAHHGYRVSAVTSGRAALERLARAEQTDAIVLDLRLPDMNGLDVLSRVQQQTPDVPVVMLTAHGSIESAVEAMRRGAYGFLTKPFHDHELLQKLAHAVESSRLRREVAGLRRVVGAADETRLVGASEALTRVRDVISRVGPADVTVLITGESGTGKELAARALHTASPRAQAPFVAVNCGAIPAELLESELFGHAKGAFTGAVKDREGLFAAAQGGTLFLDEIGEASLAVQVKLLRVLQERRYARVGSTSEAEADVRVIAATNRDLRADVAAGRFREDLFFRLHVVPLAMPPLRERPEDIPVLAELFLERAAARHRTSVPRITSAAFDAMLSHAWPGNVRELANVMEAALLLSGTDELRPEHIAGLTQPRATAAAAAAAAATAASAQAAQSAPQGSQSDGRVSHVPGTTTSSSAGEDGHSRGADSLAAFGIGPDVALPPLKEARDAFERAYLAEALRRAGGNVSAAARAAGRNRTDFYELLRRHGLSPGEFKD